MIPVYPYPSTVTFVVNATFICVFTNIPYDVTVATSGLSIIEGCKVGLQAAAVGSLCYFHQYISHLIRPLEQGRATYITLGLLVVIVVLRRDSRRRGVCKFATSTKGRRR